MAEIRQHHGWRCEACAIRALAEALDHALVGGGRFAVEHGEMAVPGVTRAGQDLYLHLVPFLSRMRLRPRDRRVPRTLGLRRNRSARGAVAARAAAGRSGPRPRVRRTRPG